jgi:hypothetical protein
MSEDWQGGAALSRTTRESGSEAQGVVAAESAMPE